MQAYCSVHPYTHILQPLNVTVETYSTDALNFVTH